MGKTFVTSFMDLDTTNTYWEHNGKYQQFVDYIEERIDWLCDDLGLGVSKTLAANYDRAAHAYKRFYNDGDIPRGYKYEFLDVAAEYLERRVNEQIVKLANALDFELEVK